MNVAKAILVGNVTRDPELKYSSDLPICKFGMAANKKRKGETKTCFIDVTAFGKAAEIISEYVSKGSSLYVEGDLEYDTWETNEGQKRSKHHVIVKEFQLGRRPNDGQAAATDVSGDPLPF